MRANLHFGLIIYRIVLLYFVFSQVTLNSLLGSSFGLIRKISKSEDKLKLAEVGPKPVFIWSPNFELENFSVPKIKNTPGTILIRLNRVLFRHQ